MTRKKWLLLVIVALLIFGYIKLFYKTYNRDAVGKSADCIVMLDVKRITNTIIWNAITTPSQWKIGNIFSSRKKEPGLKDMVDIPDYVMVYHLKDQPANAWYLALTINDEEKFRQGLQQYHFEKISDKEYGLANTGIRLIRNGDRILIGTGALKDPQYFAQAANELFVQKAYASDDMIRKAIDAKSHLAVQINANSFLGNDGLIKANFDKEKIIVDGKLTPKAEYVSEEVKLDYSDASLYTLGFAQPTTATYALLGDSAKRKISTALNFDIDSFFIPANRSYNLDLAEISSRIDSAITYSYDDDFNKIEKKVANKVTEPAFDLTITGDSTTNIYNYFQHRQLLETSDSGELFTPIPFVRSYVQQTGQKIFTIRSGNYKEHTRNEMLSCIFFQKIVFSSITTGMWKYVPDAIRKAFANIADLTMQANKQGGDVIIHCTIHKKKNDLPIIKL